eukprot:29561-Lingulodinium_polyedra.AAC.1
MAWRNKQHINIAMAAGETHWQNGVVERRIQTFKRTNDKNISTKLKPTRDRSNNQPTTKRHS